MVIDNSENLFITVAEGQETDYNKIQDSNVWNKMIEISKMEKL